MKPKLSSIVGGSLIVISALMTMVVYVEYTNLTSTATQQLIFITLIWSCLCLPELLVGIDLLLRQKSLASEINEEDIIPVLIANDIRKTPDEILIICPHCEYAFPDSGEISGSEVCPNCANLVVPML